MPITYKNTPPSELNLDTFIEIYNTSKLAERRPADDRATMADMLQHADLLITAWDEDKLVGIARTLTDFSFAAYLSDLAVHVDYQRQGIGKALIAQTQQHLQPGCTIILLAAPAAKEYYPRIGMQAHDSAWILRGSNRLT